MRKFFDWLFDPYTPEFYPAVFYLGVVVTLLRIRCSPFQLSVIRDLSSIPA